MAHPEFRMFCTFLFPFLNVPLCLCYLLDSSICSTPSSFSPPYTYTLFFPSRTVFPRPPVRQSCARCHVAAMVFAQRAGASVKRAGLAPRATRERAILAAKNMASATMGPASASLAGRESTATLVRTVLVHVGVFNYSL